MPSSIGTRYRNNISKSAMQNATRRQVTSFSQNVGGFTVTAADISFATTNTISSAGAGFPVFFDNSAVNVDFADYVANGAFATDTIWTKGAGWEIGTGVATATTASTALSQTAAVTLVAGRTYTLTYTITRTAGTITPSIGGTNGVTRNGNGTFTETIVAGSTQVIAFTGSGFSGTVDNVVITAWELGAGWSVASGAASATTASADLTQNTLGGLVEGNWYSVTFTATRSAGTVAVSLGGGAAGTARSSNGTYTELLQAGSTQVIAFTGSGFSGTIDDVSVVRMAVSPGQLIEVVGSALNSRTYEIVSANASTITVLPAMIQNEAAGPSIQIRTV